MQNLSHIFDHLQDRVAVEAVLWGSEDYALLHAAEQEVEALADCPPTPEVLVAALAALNEIRTMKEAVVL